MKILILATLLLLAIWLCDTVLPQLPWPLGSTLGFLLPGLSSFLLLWHLHLRIFGYRPRFFP